MIGGVSARADSWQRRPKNNKFRSYRNDSTRLRTTKDYSQHRSWRRDLQFGVGPPPGLLFPTRSAMLGYERLGTRQRRCGGHYRRPGQRRQSGGVPSASSTAGNRFDLGGDFSLLSKSAAHLKYDGNASRWRNTSGAGGGGGGWHRYKCHLRHRFERRHDHDVRNLRSGTDQCHAPSQSVESDRNYEHHGLMMGLGTTCKITPVYSGRVKVEFIGGATSTGSGQASTIKTFFGGTAPTNGAAIAGTQIGNQSVIDAPGANFKETFASGGIITGLTPGAAYWFDVSLASSSSSFTSSVLNLSCSAFEF